MTISLKAIVSLTTEAWRLAGVKAPGLLWRYIELSLFVKKTAKRTIQTTEMKLNTSKEGIENKARRGDLIIPVYNNFKDVKNLLRQIDQSDLMAEQVIVVNDASTDEKILPLLRAFVQAAENRLLINNENNLGFVGSVNRGIDKSNNDVIILNTDIVLPDTGLSRLFNRLWQDPDIATVTPFTNAGYLVGFPHLTQINPMPWQATVEDIDRCFRQFFPLAAIDVPSGVGFCMAINRRCLDTVSGLDDVYGPGYGEETDFCRRAEKAGFRNVIAPDIFVYHRNAGSFGCLNPQNLKRKNALRILQSHPEYQKKLSDFFAAGKADLVSFLALILLCEHLSGDAFKLRLADDDTVSDPAKTPILNINSTQSSITATLLYRDEKYQKNFVDMDCLMSAIDLIRTLRPVD